MSEYFPKSLNDFVISLSKENGDHDKGKDQDKDEKEEVVGYKDDKEVVGPEFFRAIAKQTLEALAYLDYKKVVHTNLVIN